MHSLVDDPKFFLAPDGRDNPESELEATIRAFFSPETGDGSARCRFPARYDWLKTALRIDESRLPGAYCPAFEKAIGGKEFRRAVLVFPTAHMNSPASMFGHTLIRIDTGYRSKLLSYAVNYSANATDTNGLLFAFKGLFGFYKGYFSILPYYEKVKEYNNMDQRDMWEYNLDLTPEEIRRMVLHIWELQGIYSYYYFLDENCSYNLLFLLEAARPPLDLTDRFRLSAIPVDTIKAVGEAGLISGVEYRPSQATVIREKAALVNGPDRAEALAISEGKTGADTFNWRTESRNERILTDDLAIELLQYNFSKGKIPKTKYKKAFLSVLEARGKLGAEPSMDGEDPNDTGAERPDRGHGSRRAGIGFGFRRGAPFIEMSYRPAYHDLLDPSQGYVSGSQIEFLSISARYYIRENRLRLSRMNFISIVSLAPRDWFFKPVSWKIDTGLLEKAVSADRDSTVFFLNPGGGFAWNAGNNGLFYALLETDVNAGDRLRDKYAIGPGASAGIIASVAGGWKTHTCGRWTQYVAGDRHTELSLESAHRFRLGPEEALDLIFSGSWAYGSSRPEAIMKLNRYF